MLNSSNITTGDVNSLTSDSFLKIFRNVVEHYPQAAVGIIKNRPFESADDICDAVASYLDCLSSIEKEHILKLHPDLAGKLADSGKLTNESAQEQKTVGLDHITSENKEKLCKLNEEYRNKYGFPFIICAKENTLDSILSGLTARLQSNRDAELDTAIEEVKKISNLRILEIVKH